MIYSMDDVAPRRSPEPVPQARTGAPVRPESESPPRELRIAIAPGPIVRGLVLAIGILAVASVAAHLALGIIVPGTWRGVVQVLYWVDLDHENNIPTWFTTQLLFVCGLLLAAIAHGQRREHLRYAMHWWLLSLGFFYLSLDESAVLHEILINPLRRRLDTHGIFYFAWVIPGAMLVAGIGLTYLRFLVALDLRTRWLFLTAAALYVGGALGLELIGGALAESRGYQSPGYLAAMTAEEVLEMLGLTTFLYALLDYLGRDGRSLRLSVDRGCGQLQSRDPDPY